MSWLTNQFFLITVLHKDVSSTTKLAPVGADLYRAPEMEKGVCITNKVDMYALGLILFQLFGPRGDTAIQRLKDSASPRQVCEICEKYKMDETVKPLILKLLRTDPLKRPSAADLLQDLDTLEGKKQEAQLQKLS
ncbi:eukaryotic translation initiation factor 2-alpha kinase 1-like [Coffea eugenioides]|uniref:eukaryotic translation initiation factor 2-alpha kinase 1-like n=1 Tax=Coffea eugenioides TaxID=49369 RepID=UPI000F60EBDC|nr:eukaryotic translation initiation factor 2-alpha kinase 1-like [Coffea eugenioides]